jgi:hypothetical protein
MSAVVHPWTTGGAFILYKKKKIGWGRDANAAFLRAFIELFVTLHYLQF